MKNHIKAGPDRQKNNNHKLLAAMLEARSDRK